MTVSILIAFAFCVHNYWRLCDYSMKPKSDNFFYSAIALYGMAVFSHHFIRMQQTELNAFRIRTLGWLEQTSMAEWRFNQRKRFLIWMILMVCSLAPIFTGWYIGTRTFLGATAVNIPKILKILFWCHSTRLDE